MMTALTAINAAAAEFKREAGYNYAVAKSVAQRLTPYEMAGLAQWLIDQLDHNHVTASGRVDIEDLKTEADGVIGEIVAVLS